MKYTTIEHLRQQYRKTKEFAEANSILLSDNESIDLQKHQNIESQ
jgi:hypothetical protein